MAMFKKLVLGVLVTGLLGGLVLGKGAWSYLTTGYERASQTVEDSVPLEFQIDRARKMVRDLEPEIRRSMHVIAKEEVEVESLDKRLATAEEKAEKEKSEIMRLQADLQSGKNVFRYAGLSYSAHEVKEDLSRRFARFKTSDATLGSLTDMRKARQANLEAAREKLTAMMNAQRQLQVEVENLEAKLKLVEVAQASSDLKLDDSQLARAKELITDIRTKLDVAAKLANADTNFKDEIPLDEPNAEDITDQITEYFHLDEANEAEIAVVKYQEK
jgi:regulator of replication initiation timing